MLVELVEKSLSKILEEILGKSIEASEISETVFEWIRKEITGGISEIISREFLRKRKEQGMNPWRYLKHNSWMNSWASP